ncbi:MAG: cation:proton antiporter [Armatimonadota bacterium]
MEQPLLYDVIVISGLSVVTVYACRLLRVPGIVGFLVAGAAAGPHGLRLITSVEQVETLAGIGIIALLFTIGLEFSLEQLWRIRKAILLGGSAQVLLTAGAAGTLALWFGQSRVEAVLIGCLVALSSTAVVLSLLQQAAEVNTPHGRVTLAILIFQDVIVVAMLLLVPFLAGGAAAPLRALLVLVAKTVVVAAGVTVMARWVVPGGLARIARTGDRELFVVAVIFITLAIAWLTSLLGLSLALGAFLAGLIVSASEHSHRALGSVLPFRDVFTSFFFVSVGMLLDVQFVVHSLPLMLGTGLGIIALKAVLAAAAVLLLGYPLRTALIAGMALAQIGEFSFIVFQAAVGADLLGEATRQLFLAVTVLTMMLTPALVGLAPRVAERASHLRVLQRLQRHRPLPETAEAARLADHLIIVGFGFTGQNLARAARATGVPYIVMELNPDTVARATERGEPIFCGDATHAPALQHAGIERARVLAVVISDAAGTRRVVEQARHLNPACHLVVRTHFVSEMPDLVRLGANEVVPEEFAASVEIFSRVLRSYLIPPERIDELVAQLQADSYALLTGREATEAPARGGGPATAWHLDIAAMRLCPGSPLVGKSPQELELRARHGVTLLAVQRHREAIANPPPNFTLQADDIVIAMGDRSRLAEFAAACGRT